MAVTSLLGGAMAGGRAEPMATSTGLNRDLIGPTTENFEEAAPAPTSRGSAHGPGGASVTSAPSAIAVDAAPATITVRVKLIDTIRIAVDTKRATKDLTPMERVRGEMLRQTGTRKFVSDDNPEAVEEVAGVEVMNSS